MLKRIQLTSNFQCYALIRPTQLEQNQAVSVMSWMEAVNVLTYWSQQWWGKVTKTDKMLINICLVTCTLYSFATLCIRLWLMARNDDWNNRCWLSWWCWWWARVLLFFLEEIMIDDKKVKVRTQTNLKRLYVSYHFFCDS